MRKLFVKQLSIIILIFTAVSTVASYHWLVDGSIDNIYENSKLSMEYIEQSLIANSADIQELRATTYESYLSNAESLAYIISQNPTIIDDYDELLNIADIIDIDEINIFDENGVIISSTNDLYIGVSVDEGEQIGFFKAILNNPTLKLVQKVLPSSHSGNLMQYIGVARRDEKGIVQIGMSPKSITQSLDRARSDNVISTIATDKGEEIFVLDKETGIVFASTNPLYMNANLYEKGLNKDKLGNIENEMNVELESDHGYAVLRQNGNNLICVYHERSVVLNDINNEVALITIGIITASILLIIAIIKLLNCHVVQGIEEIIEDLSKITNGDLYTVISVNSNPEFSSLSKGINTMVDHLLKTTANLSHVIEAVDVDIGVYEYRKDAKKVFITDRLANIMGLSDGESLKLLNDKELFEEKLEEIRQSIYDCTVGDGGGGESVYFINFSHGNRYIKINSYTDNSSTLGIVIDVTGDVVSRNVIIKERDYDALTDLHTRKAFMRISNEVFSNLETIKKACVIVVDLDNLKAINDNFGHKMGDEYINLGAKVFKNTTKDNGIVSRFGGDEFAMVWYGFENKEEIIKILNQLEATMQENFIITNDGEKHLLSFSAGYVFFPDYNVGISELLHFADLAMYQSKQAGKRQIKQYVLPIDENYIFKE